MTDLEKQCSVADDFTLGEPSIIPDFSMISAISVVICRSKNVHPALVKGALGFRIAEQLKNFLGHFLESKGSQVRIMKID